MPWVKFSDDWYDDPELIEAGPAAMLLWPLLISWSARNLTDGKIPAGQVRRLVDWHTLGLEPDQAIGPLLASGRLQDIAGGYLITNYLEYQPSKEKVLADRDAAKGRAAKSRERAAHVRDECGDGADAPVPVPVPDNSSSSSVTQTGLPADLWTKVAEKQLKATRSTVNRPEPWLRKAARNAQDEMQDRAIELVRNYRLTTPQLVDVLLSPTNPAWLSGLRRSEPA